MKKDRAQHTILPLSKFGLMQITRQRVRPEVKINTAEVCPSCNGTGKINPSILLVDDIQRDLDFILQSRPNSKIQLKSTSVYSCIPQKRFSKYSNEVVPKTFQMDKDRS